MKCPPVVHEVPAPEAQRSLAPRFSVGKLAPRFPKSPGGAAYIRPKPSPCDCPAQSGFGPAVRISGATLAAIWTAGVRHECRIENSFIFLLQCTSRLVHYLTHE